MKCGVLVTLGTTVHSRRSESGRLLTKGESDLPVLPSAQLSEVLCRPELHQTTELRVSRGGNYFGQMSLKSSILSRPMGVSPMLMSMKTIGLVVVAGVDEDIPGLAV